MVFTFAYRALPCGVFPPSGQNPVIPRSFLAVLVASAHFFRTLPAKAFLLRIEAALATILPLLFLVSEDLDSPPEVFSFVPLKTEALAIGPTAILLTDFFFMAFLTVAFIAGLLFFIAAFMATFLAAFMAAFFIGAAMIQCDG